MTRPGPKPKPARLHLINGTLRTDRHGANSAKETAAVPPTLKPQMPATMRGHAAKAWKRYIAPAGWLDQHREPTAIAFCELWAEFVERPAGFPAAKHSQMRAYLGELGLTDDRNRAMLDAGERDEFDEFFGD